MDRREARTHIVGGLANSGFQRAGKFWRLVGEDMQWIAYPEMLPTGGLGVSFGAILDLDSAPVAPSYCAVYLFLEVLPFASGLEAAIALTLDSPSMTDAERATQLTRLGEEAGRFTAQRSSVSDLLAAHREGDFHSGFVRSDVRELSEADSARRKLQIAHVLRAERLFRDAQAYFPKRLWHVESLITNGEIPIGLSTLAHEIVAFDVPMPASIINGIIEGVTGTDEEAGLPVNFSQLAVRES